MQWNPYGPLAGMNFGYGGVASFTTDTDYRITRYQVGTAANPSLTIDRSLAWTGDIVTSNGNRASETANGVVSTYAYPAESNRLSSMTPAGKSARRVSCDGGIHTDTRSGGLESSTSPLPHCAPSPQAL